MWWWCIITAIVGAGIVLIITLLSSKRIHSICSYSSKGKYIIFADFDNKKDAIDNMSMIKELGIEEISENIYYINSEKAQDKNFEWLNKTLNIPDDFDVQFDIATLGSCQISVARYSTDSIIPKEIVIDEVKTLRARLSAAEEEINIMKSQPTNIQPDGSNQSDERVNATKEKYEKLLAEANAKIKELDNQLSLSMSGNVDASVKSQLAEAEKLKKKIKDLQDDLEEAEDDADTYKKKFKAKETEASNLHDEVSKLNTSNKKLSDDLQRAIDELSEKKQELELKMKSLSFVQEVLTAPKTKDAALDELHDKVDDVADYIRSDFYDCVTTLFQKNDSWDYYFGGGLSYWEAVSCKKWIQGKTTIAFVGEFSAGKTSIVNRVLSQDQPNVALLPVSAKATTAIPTYITGGVGISYNFVSADQSLKTIRESTFKEVSKEVLGQINGISSLIKYFVMQYKNPFLDKISILDTPGFNSNDSEDTSRTIEVINECDALFWVIDVNAGSANRTSLKTIHDHLQKPLYVIINQIDTKSKSEVDKVEQLLRKQFSDAGIQVKQYVRFSKKEPLAVIMNAIKSVPQNSNEDYLEYLTGAFIPDLISVYNKETKEANNVYQAKEKEAEKINNQFYNVAKTTQGRCQEAAGIPQLTDRIFLDNIFKMSESQGRRLINLLGQIADNDINNMWQAFNNSFDAAQDVQDAYAYYVDSKANYQRVTNCAEQLTKRINAYKAFIRKV